jgi:hypothetical protein
MTTRSSTVVPLISAAIEFVRRVATVIETDVLPSLHAQLSSAESSPPEEAFSIVNDVVIALGRFSTTDNARAAISESREVIDYPALVKIRDSTLRSLYADYKLNGGKALVASITKRAADAGALTRKDAEKLVRELWDIKDKGSSLVFAAYDPEPLPTKTKVPAASIVELAIANTQPFSYDVRAIFDMAMIASRFPTRSSESIDKRAVARYQQLIVAHDKLFTTGSPPPVSCPEHAVFYRIGANLHRARVSGDDYDLVLTKANEHCNKVIEDEILKFYDPSRLEHIERRKRNESNRPYTDAIVTSFSRNKDKRRPLLIALGETFPERDSHTLASLINFYRMNIRLDREKPDNLRRKLAMPSIARQLSAIRGGDEEYELFDENGLYNLEVLDE